LKVRTSCVEQCNLGNSGCGERKLDLDIRLSAGMAVGASRAAGSRTWAKRLIHDLLDGASAPAALCAATQTSIDLSRCARRQLGDTHGAAHVVVAQDVAGTNDHGREGLAGGIDDWICKTGSGCKRKNAFSSNSKLQGLGWNQARNRVVPAGKTTCPPTVHAIGLP
jgi:hypothetical protein